MVVGVGKWGGARGTGVRQAEARLKLQLHLWVRVWLCLFFRLCQQGGTGGGHWAGVTWASRPRS